MFQQALQTNFQRVVNFFGFARGFFHRRNPLKAFADGLVEMVKDFLTVKKKLKMAQYRLNYHRHQLHKMESLIAENNEHAFLKGRKMNHFR